MAGLNDSVDDDLDGLVDPSDPLVTPPNENKGREKEIVIVTPEHPVDEDRTAIDKMFSGVEEGELPNLDVKFKLLENGRANIIDLKEVEQALVNDNAISQEEANFVEYRFGNLFTNRLTAKQFTKTPTQCGYKETMQYLRTRIAKEEAGIINLIEAAVDKPLEDLKQFEYQVIHVYLPYMQDQIRDVQNEYEDVLKDIQVSKNSILPVGNEFLNIVSCPIDFIPLKELDFTNTVLKDKGNLPAHFVLAVEALVNSLKYVNLNHFIHDTLKNERFKFDRIYGKPPESVTILDLVNLYKAELFEDNLSAVKETLLKTIDDMKALSSELHELIHLPDEMNKKLLEKSAEMQDISYRAGVCYGISRQIINLNTAMKQVFPFLRFCL